MGRFKVLNEWRYSLNFLEDAIACMMIAMNVELFLRHGNRGRYKPLTPEKLVALNNKAEHHVMQNVRYPYKPPLVCLKDEHAEVEKAIAENRAEQEAHAQDEEKKGNNTRNERKPSKKRTSRDVTEVSEEEHERRRAEALKTRADQKRILELEQKELETHRKGNEDAQKRLQRSNEKKAHKAADDERIMGPRITGEQVEQRIMRLINDAKRRKANRPEETD